MTKTDEEKAEYNREYRNAHKEEMKVYQKKYCVVESRRRWSSDTLLRHKKCGFDVNITRREMRDIANRTDYCPICETKLNWCHGTKRTLTESSPTLDRVNNETVINKDNVWIICSPCNTMKQDNTWSELVEWCEKVIALDERMRSCQTS